MMKMIQSWIYLQEHDQQRHPDGNFRQETTKQPPLHFGSWSGLQSTANIVTPLSFNLTGTRKKKEERSLNLCH